MNFRPLRRLGVTACLTVSLASTHVTPALADPANDDPFAMIVQVHVFSNPFIRHLGSDNKNTLSLYARNYTSLADKQAVEQSVNFTVTSRNDSSVSQTKQLTYGHLDRRLYAGFSPAGNFTATFMNLPDDDYQAELNHDPERFSLISHAVEPGAQGSAALPPFHHSFMIDRYWHEGRCSSALVQSNDFGTECPPYQKNLAIDRSDYSYHSGYATMAGEWVLAAKPQGVKIVTDHGLIETAGEDPVQEKELFPFTTKDNYSGWSFADGFEEKDSTPGTTGPLLSTPDEIPGAFIASPMSYTGVLWGDSLLSVPPNPRTILTEPVLSADEEKSGLKFAGWQVIEVDRSTGAENEVQVLSTEEALRYPITKNTVFKAQWHTTDQVTPIGQVTATFSANPERGLVDGARSQHYTVDKGASLASSNIAVPTVVSREGYVFKGWYTNEATEELIDSDQIVQRQLDDDTTFYAKLAPINECVDGHTHGSSLSPWALPLTALALGVASVVGPWIARFTQSIFGMAGQHAHHDNRPEFLKEWDRGVGRVGEDLDRAFAPLRAEMDRIVTPLRLEAEKAAPVAGPLALLGIVGVIAAWYDHYSRTNQDCTS
ncbi:InlB B-repeat-containing protein [Corynebacterium sp. ES2730-CONJ]|uniref:InlB B-repeat-containing protein n=1 Tax=Corynebacterium sp. ES2730-CONJ TaxID=2973941 RepID=UPI00216B2D86|nr:InlB B-repeat-containing protein [Corynebacterium sp. ES2730-CONJ]MCS4532683.1 InlB B-repeat-containing protein [Corynebacterium sp. ES2730-CONJ]